MSQPSLHTRPLEALRRAVSVCVVAALFMAGLVTLGSAVHADPGSDGTLDTTFSTNLGGGFNGNVWSVAAQTDGKVVVGGSFTAVNGVTSNRIARLNADGTVDAAFSANLGTGPDNDVLSVAVQTDGKIVLGGWFTAVNGTLSARIARLNTDGTVDSSFSANTGSGFDFDVRTVTIQPDGKMVVGGAFNAVNGTTSIRIARLNSNGTVDTAFSANTGGGLNDKVEAVAVQADGKILVAGYLFTINGIPSKHIARFNANGTPDTAFAANSAIGLTGIPFALGIQSDAKVVLGGNFTNVNGTVSSRIARLNSDGTVDANFSSNLGTGFDGSVYALAVQADGKVVVAGTFTKFNGVPSKSVARLLPDGRLDTAFSTNTGTGFSGPVRALALQADGNILAGGAFGLFNETSSNKLALLRGTAVP
ncbi:MAG: hypothetical protein WBB41_00350 [Candidatus Nanopelagicales bacterium]